MKRARCFHNDFMHFHSQTRLQTINTSFSVAFPMYSVLNEDASTDKRVNWQPTIFFFFFTAIQCTFTLFPPPNSTNVSKLHATHNSIIAITTFALISRPVSVHVTVNKHSGLIKYIHSTYSGGSSKHHCVRFER
jgi:hypothetical protein